MDKYFWHLNSFSRWEGEYECFQWSCIIKWTWEIIVVWQSWRKTCYIYSTVLHANWSCCELSLGELRLIMIIVDAYSLFSKCKSIHSDWGMSLDSTLLQNQLKGKKKQVRCVTTCYFTSSWCDAKLKDTLAQQLKEKECFQGASNTFHNMGIYCNTERHVRQPPSGEHVSCRIWTLEGE